MNIQFEELPQDASSRRWRYLLVTVHLKLTQSWTARIKGQLRYDYRRDFHPVLSLTN